jgi:hypothetical protein
METFDPKVLRKLFRMSPRAKRHFDETRAALRADRVATPPGPGNLRDLKGQADREAFQKTYDALASEPSLAEDAKLYDHLFTKAHGNAAVRTGA